ncbi:hypothetical protein RRG08_063087 [Elysia crispata]|uniref:C-type lectin domain-containing protein n=1 Tax=Elysia crispata TaxID=231223 RepID=A0AAE1D194_9GAST|nr:hypothetical protein RRG08_063087 [Elysia crispata]
MIWKYSLTDLAVVLSLIIMTTGQMLQDRPSLADYASGEVVLTLVPDKLTWDQAYHACDSLLGGTLARIDSHEADQAIRQFSTTTWAGYAWADSWFGIQWRQLTQNGYKKLVWSDNCQDLNTLRYHNFKSGDGTYDGKDFCYRMKSDYEWERKVCGERNSFIYPGNFTTDTGSGMMVVTKNSALNCSEVCNQLHGCYRVSDLGNSSCIVDLVSDDPTDAVTSLFKPMLITSSVLELTNAQKTAIEVKVINLPVPLWDSLCEPQVNFSAPSGMVAPHDIDVPTVLASAEPCTSTFILQTSSCAIIQPSTSTEVRTTTVLDTVTLTPEVSTVPTTVRYTHTVTETAQLFSSCSPEVITVSTSNCVGVTPSASTMFHTTTVYGTVTETPLVNIVPTTVVLTDTVTRTLDASSCTPIIVPDIETITKTQTVSAASSVCPTQATVYNLTSKNIDLAVSSIVSELSINERSTSRSRAKYKSAPDHRVSSQTMGLISMGFILMVMLLILAIDAPTMIMALKDKILLSVHVQSVELLLVCQMFSAFSVKDSADYASREVELTLVPDKLPWDEAHQACHSLRAALARIDSHEADQTIRHFFNTTWKSYIGHNFWFGIHCRQTTESGPRRLFWSDNYQVIDKLRYQNFESGFCAGCNMLERESSSHSENSFCYRLKRGFKWERKPCDDENSFICEHRIFSPNDGSQTLIVNL